MRVHASHRPGHQIQQRIGDGYLFTPLQDGQDGLVVVLVIAHLRQSGRALTGRSHGLLQRLDLHSVHASLSAQRAEDGHLTGGIRALNTQGPVCNWDVAKISVQLEWLQDNCVA